MAGRVRRHYGDSNQIRQDLFELMVGDGWTEQQVCDRFGVTKNTLKAWIRETYNDEIVNYQQAKERFMQELRSDLLQIGMRHARRSSVAWIFMAKNLLGMTDTPNAKQQEVQQRQENSQSMAEAITAAAQAMKGIGINDEDLADIPSDDDDGDIVVEDAEDDEEDDFDVWDDEENDDGEKPEGMMMQDYSDDITVEDVE